METQRIVVISAIAALCIAVLMSGYFTRMRKQNAKKIMDTHMPGQGMPNIKDSMDMHSPTHSKKKEGENKPKKKNWANTMLPFYSLGILAYVLFVVGKIMSKKYSDVKKNDHVKLSWSRQQRLNKGKTKTKITMHELRQLEDKLMETEKAVQEIFSRACDAMSATQKALDSDSSEDQSITTSKRHLENSATTASSTEDEVATMPLSKTRSSDDTKRLMHGVRHVRRRKRSSRERSKATQHQTFHSSSSESETDLNLPSHESENSELLETAHNIREIMSELQSYLDDKKSELSDS